MPGEFDIPPPPGPSPTNVPVKKPPFRRHIPGFARKLGKFHPFLRALDLYLQLRESGALGWIGQEPGVVADWDAYNITGTSCPGNIPWEFVGHLNGCYPDPAVYPGVESPIPNKSQVSFSVWGRTYNQFGSLRWYPAKGFPRKSVNIKPKFQPYMSPALISAPVVNFPPVPAFKDRHHYGLKDPVKTLARDKPTETPKEYPDKKMKMPKALRLAMEAAFAGTELVDLLDNMFEHLPSHYKNVPKTGRCTTGCRNPGAKFHTPHDKAMAIAKAWPHLDGKTVAKILAALAVNQAADAVMGRFFGVADRARKRAGGSGWGFATG